MSFSFWRINKLRSDPLEEVTFLLPWQWLQPSEIRLPTPRPPPHAHAPWPFGQLSRQLPPAAPWRWGQTCNQLLPLLSADYFFAQQSHAAAVAAAAAGPPRRQSLGSRADSSCWEWLTVCRWQSPWSPGPAGLPGQAGQSARNTPPTRTGTGLPEEQKPNEKSGISTTARAKICEIKMTHRFTSLPFNFNVSPITRNSIQK